MHVAALLRAEALDPARQAGQVIATAHAQPNHRAGRPRLEGIGRGSDPREGVAERRKVGLAGGRQHELAVQPLE